MVHFMYIVKVQLLKNDLTLLPQWILYQELLQILDPWFNISIFVFILTILISCHIIIIIIIIIKDLVRSLLHHVWFSAKKSPWLWAPLVVRFLSKEMMTGFFPSSSCVWILVCEMQNCNMKAVLDLVTQALAPKCVCRYVHECWY